MKPIRTEYQKEIDVRATLSKKDARILLELLEETKDGAGGCIAGFSPIIERIKRQLKRIYIYNIKCCGCGKLVEYDFLEERNRTQLRDIEEYALCNSCYDSEDFK